MLASSLGPATAAVPGRRAMQHDLDVWRDALHAFDNCDYEIAIDHFRRIGNISKALFNTGVAHIALGQTACAVSQLWVLQS